MNINLSHASRIGLNIVGLLGTAVALYLGRSILIPLMIASLLAVLLFPAVESLNRRLRVPWTLSCFVILTILVAANLAVFGGAVSVVLRGLPNPNRRETRVELYDEIRAQFAKVTPDRIDEYMPMDPDESTVFSYVEKTIQGEVVTGKLIELGQYGASWLWQSILILFILMFLLLEGDMLARRIREIFGDSVVTQTGVTGALVEMGDAVSAYLIWRTVVNIGLGLFLGLVYSVVGLKQPWTWAMFTALLCYVPYIGTILAGVPPVLDALITVSPWAAIGIVVFYMLVVTIEGYIIVPVVMGRSMDLNATTVMVSCLFWDLIWGIPGLFLAMPLMAAVRAVCLHVEGWESWGHLMSTERGVVEARELHRIKTIGAKIASNDRKTIVSEG